MRARADGLTAGDVQIVADPIERVKNMAPRLFREGSFDPFQTALTLIAEAVLGGSGRVALERRARWWVVAGERDWLAGDEGLSSFRTTTFYREGEHEWLSYEVALTAFAADVVTAAAGRVDVVKGARDEVLDEALAAHRAAGRVVAFRAPPP